MKKKSPGRKARDRQTNSRRRGLDVGHSLTFQALFEASCSLSGAEFMLAERRGREHRLLPPGRKNKKFDCWAKTKGRRGQAY